MMLAYGAVFAPVPGVNEPHYLGKAKHFWNPAWCPGDLLLESANAHYMFYVMAGFWAHWFSLPALAVIGRLIGYGLLARGWQRLHESLHVRGWLSCLSLLVFLTSASWGNFSGEWLIGGIEGKTISYACLMLAFANWQQGYRNWAALQTGLAISFHPVVGAWGLLAALLTILSQKLCPSGPLAPAAGERARVRGQAFADSPTLITPSAQAPLIRPSATFSPTGKKGPFVAVIEKLLPVTLLLLAAAPGLIPALQLVFTNDPADVRINGTYLQVYYRLAHHLDPMKFPLRSYLAYAGLSVAVLLLSRPLWRIPTGRVWLIITAWSAMFAFGGIVAGFGPRPPAEMPYYLERMTLLKFYPFRLFDVLMPFTFSIQLASLIRNTKSTSLVVATILIGLTTLAGGCARHSHLQKSTPFDSGDWVAVCHWFRDHTTTNALVQTPIHNPNFKWHAGRAEYVTYKDMPQDNVSLVEWNRRLRFLGQWYHDHGGDGYSAAELINLRQATGIDYILTDRLGPFDIAPCYTNQTFRVYDLRNLPSERGASAP